MAWCQNAPGISRSIFAVTEVNVEKLLETIVSAEGGGDSCLR